MINKLKLKKNDNYVTNPITGKKIKIKYDRRFKNKVISQSGYKKLLKNAPKGYNFNKNTLKYEKKIQPLPSLKKLKKLRELEELLRDNREVTKNYIKQNSPIDISPYVPIVIKKDDEGREVVNTFDDLADNEYLQLFDENLYMLIQKAINSIIKTRKYINEYMRSVIQVLYVFEVDEAEPVYTKIETLTDNANDIKFKTPTPASGRRVILGYKINIISSSASLLPSYVINEYKAYHPCNNIDFHKLSVVSTSASGLCIYESWRHIFGIKNLKHSRRENKSYRTELYSALKNEGEEIEKAVKNGELVKSICLLTKKYNKDVIINFFGSYLECNEEKEVKITGDTPLYIDNGELKEFNWDIIKKYNGRMAFLYEKHKHVAPYKFKISVNDKKIRDIKTKKNNGFCLKPVELKKKDIEPMGILGFDSETFRDNNNMSTPFNLTLYGTLKNEHIEKSYYGVKCVSEFVEYINKICIKMNDKKTNPNKAIPPIYIYGFNNSRFDNLLIYKQFYEIDPNTEYIFTNNAIKYIKFNNVYIYDMCCFYAGSLSKCAESFGLTDKKGLYPYSFPNANNLNYIGDIPNIKYWKSKEEYEEYCLYNETTFNLKEVTEKYCLQDSKLVFDIACKHILNCIGEINGRKYNVQKCSTSANLSLKTFTQCFLNETLYQSPDDIIKCERLAYFGGKTEVFKKSFNKKLDKFAKKILNYYDINSSYPASMTKIMPVKFIKSYDIEETNVNINELTDYYLYYAKCEYKGNNKYYIPNLFKRLVDGRIITSKKTDYSYHWGCELKESLKSECEIIVKRVIMYEGRAIFKDFAEYYYNERLKVKKSNASKSQYYKTVMNSLYGKYGQKAFNHSTLCNIDDIGKVIKNDIKKLINIKEIDDKICLVEYKEENDETNSIGNLVRFSSYISALSRTNLCEVIRDVGYENVFYCDTDSIFSTKEPSSKYLDNNELGKWKKENEEEITEAEFLAPKSYTYKYASDDITIKAKGLNFNFDSIKDKKEKQIKMENKFNEMKAVNIGDQVKGLKCESLMFFRSLNGVRIESVERTLKPVRNKRIFNGNDSEAFESIVNGDENEYCIFY